MRILLTTSGLLLCSSLFMAIAWYGHLRKLRDRPWLVAALVSWVLGPVNFVFRGA
jgi:uncharacterized protein (DUF486 family)